MVKNIKMVVLINGYVIELIQIMKQIIIMNIYQNGKLYGLRKSQIGKTIDLCGYHYIHKDVDIKWK